MSEAESPTETPDGWVCTMRNGGRRRVVHATEKCAKDHGALTVRPARLDEVRRLPECADCLGGENYRDSSNPSRKCPKCRTRTHNLGNHLRHCDGGDGDE